MRPYDRTYSEVFDALPPHSVNYLESNADIISPGRGFRAAFDITMQLMVGCPAGCLFCYVPSGRFLTPPAVKGLDGRTWGFEARIKKNGIEKFKKHLYKGDFADKCIYWSGVTDPYVAHPPVTRKIWQMLCDLPKDLSHLKPKRIVVQTRFRADRDADLIAQYCDSTRSSDGGPPVVISYSTGTDREDLIRAWERATPSFKLRMEAIRCLRSRGIVVTPTLSPFGLWRNLPQALREFKRLGIPYITCLFFKVGTKFSNTPLGFTEFLRETYPCLLDRNWQRARLQEMKDIYGEGRVLEGQAGFTSLAQPHFVCT